MSRYVVAGFSQIETMVKVEKLPLEYTSLVPSPNSIYSSVGGDAYNAALALKWLGNDVTLFSMVGRDQNMDLFNPPERKVTISTQYVLPLLESTPQLVMLFDSKRNEQRFEDTKNIRDVDYDMSMVAPLVAESDIVMLSNANFCRPFINAAHEHKKQVLTKFHAFRREKEKYNEDFLSESDIIFFSSSFLDEDPFEFVKDIEKKYGTDIIVLSQGKDGLIMYQKDKDMIAHYDSVATNQVVSSMGAGNALAACFIHRYTETGDPVIAIKDALLFASYKTGFIGTSNGFMTDEQLTQWHRLIWGI
jgi:ribokinase